MEFFTIYFIVFVALAGFLIYQLSGEKKINALLILSFVFIASQSIKSFLLLFFLFSSTYGIGSFIAKEIPKKTKTLLLIFGISLNIFCLVFFKYFKWNNYLNSFDFFNDNYKTNSWFVFLGLSYYSLHHISFLLEVFNNQLPKKITWKEFGLYSSFFPKFISGPITSPSDFFDELKNHKYDINNIVIGSQRILLGVFKKVVLADRIAPHVNYYMDFSQPGNAYVAIIVIYLYTLELYFDFSAYSDMAIGASRILGIHLKENFNLPLRAKSIGDFWRTWHISLSTWLYQYIYFPLAFKFRSLKSWGIYAAILVTFLISGFWHGWGLTFFSYAFCHAVYLIAEYRFKPFNQQLKLYFGNVISKYLGVIVTFNLVSLSLIFFRSASILNAKKYFSILLSIPDFSSISLFDELLSKIALGGDLESLFNFFVTLTLTLYYLIFEKYIYNSINLPKINTKLIFMMILLMALFGIFNHNQQFIYLQF